MLKKSKSLAYSVERIVYSKELNAIRYPLNAKTFCYLVVLICASSLIGCVTAPYVPPKPQFAIPGIYHRVERGQTLWRISKMYGVQLEEIVRINRIPDAASIEPNQLIFIPSAQKIQLKRQALPQQSSADDFAWPLKGRVITSFGQTFNDMINKGINIQKTASQDVTASRSGRVVFYDANFNNFGKTIIIDHGDGFSTVYARNSEVLVKTGDYVQRGSLIARVGTTDRDKNTYLHFQIRKGHIPQNPYFYLPR